MNKLIEGIKDIVHDSIDMILVIVIFVVVGGTILWRLDILFATDMDKPAISQPSDDVASEDHSNQNNPANTPSDSNDNSSPSTNNPSDQIPDDPVTDDNSNSDSDNSNGTTDEENNEPIIVVIPQGTLAPGVGEIVLELGLIKPEEYWTFLSKAQEMKLDTKFQSGTFKIEKGASMETIIKTIARAL